MWLRQRRQRNFVFMCSPVGSGDFAWIRIRSISDRIRNPGSVYCSRAWSQHWLFIRIAAIKKNRFSRTILFIIYSPPFSFGENANRHFCTHARTGKLISGYPPSGLRLPGPELHLTRPLPNRTSSSRLLWKDCIWCTTCWAAGDVGVSNLANTVRLHIYNRQIFKRYWCSVSKNKRVLEVFNSSRFPKSVHFFEYSPFYSLTDWTIHS